MNVGRLADVAPFFEWILGVLGFEVIFHLLTLAVEKTLTTKVSILKRTPKTENPKTR